MLGLVIATTLASLVSQTLGAVVIPVYNDYIVAEIYTQPNCAGPILTTIPGPGILGNTCFGYTPDISFTVNGVPIPGVIGASIQCPSNMLMYATSPDQCVSAAVPVQDTCWNDEGPGSPTVSFRFKCPLDICKPDPGLPKLACDARIAQCAALGFPMKWTSKGCRTKRGIPLGDGGCQCNSYCGYKCRGACRRDPLCKWNQGQRKCFNKDTNLEGVPLPRCPMEYSVPTAVLPAGKSNAGPSAAWKAAIEAEEAEPNAG